MKRGYYTAWRRRTPARRLYGCATAGIALERSARATGYLLFPHSSFGRRERFDKRRPREEPLRVFHERRRGLGQLNAVVVEAPEQRGDRHIEHREVFAQHVFVLGEYRCDLQQAVAHQAAGLVELLLVVALERVDVREELLLEAVQEQPRPRTHQGIGGHQLRMRKAFVDIF